MSFIFISHAEPDKIERVRPLVEVLLAEGESVWIDRPGAGDGNFGFTQAFIDRHAIDYLHSGNSWSDSIKSAIQEAGAVLGCLSKSLRGDRRIMNDELTRADALRKLVTCIVDDLPYEEIGSLGGGLLSTETLHSPRLRGQLLRDALDQRTATGCTVEDLPVELLAEWEKVRNIISTINRFRNSPPPLPPGERALLLTQLSEVPHGPMLKIFDLPQELLRSLGDQLTEPAQIKRMLQEANQLAKDATTDPEERLKIELRLGALPALGGSADHFWNQAFREAGLISRRLVAAMVMTTSVRWALDRSGFPSLPANFFSVIRNQSRPIKQNNPPAQT